MKKQIKNIVFDVGNVLVRWDPLTVTKQHFPAHPDHQALTNQLFRSSTWHDLNKGKITEVQLIQIYQRQFGIAVATLEKLLEAIRESQLPLEGSIELLKQLHELQYSLYGLTDNTHEIFAYLNKKYDFWPLFKGVVVSADVGSLKPAAEIYQHLLNTYHLQARETLFLDDYQCNVDGAIALGINSIRFETAIKCLEDLKHLGVIS